MIVTWGIQLMFFVSVAGLIKPDWGLYTKISIVTAVVSPIIGYIMVLLNMFNGGWGRENSKFWCHMRIMYLAGYNSIRWAISSAVDPCIVVAACLIMGESNAHSIRAAISVVYCYFILSRLEQEKSSPVEWEKTIENISSLGIKNFVEIGPGNVLAGLNKRINRELNTISIGNYTNIDDALELISSEK